MKRLLLLAVLAFALVSFLALLSCSKPLVSQSAREVPGGCIDVYLVGQPWSSDIKIEERRGNRFVDLGNLGGTFQPHSKRLSVGMGRHHLRIRHDTYSGPVSTEFTREVDVEVGPLVGRRIRVSNKDVSSKQTGLRSWTIYVRFEVIVE